MALCATTRSEDNFLRVGAAIENLDGRIIATGCNGLPAKAVLAEEIANDRDARRPFMLHAEINALSLIKRGEGHKIYCTLQPCENCLNALMAHGIKEVVYLNEWENVSDGAKRIMESGWINVRRFIGSVKDIVKTINFYNPSAVEAYKNLTFS